MIDFIYEDLSSDYEALFNLLKKQRVICIVKYTKKISNNTEEELIDIAASFNLLKDNSISIGARGINYISCYNENEELLKTDFFAQCKFYKLRFMKN